MKFMRGRRVKWVMAGAAAGILWLVSACGQTAASTSTETGANNTAAQIAPQAMTITKAEDTTTINMPGDYFSPIVAVVHVGDKVTWNNTDSDPHSVVSYPGSNVKFDIDIPGGKSASFTFTKPGVYRYYCDLHATYSKTMQDVKANQGTDIYPAPMRGVIVVLDKDNTLPPSPTTTVQIPNNTMAFTPWDLVVPAGTKVTWTNSDGDPHAVATVPGYTSGEINMFMLTANGGSGSYTFQTPGVYYYYCPVHATWNRAKQQLIPLKSYGMFPYVMDGLVVVTPKR